MHNVFSASRVTYFRLKKNENDKIILKNDLIAVFDTRYCYRFSWPNTGGIVAQWVEYGSRFRETE